MCLLPWQWTAPQSLRFQVSWYWKLSGLYFGLAFSCVVKCASHSSKAYLKFSSFSVGTAEKKKNPQQFLMEIVLNSKFSSVNSLFIYKLAFTSETTSDVDLLVNCSLFTSVHILLYLKKYQKNSKANTTATTCSHMNIKDKNIYLWVLLLSLTQQKPQTQCQTIYFSNFRFYIYSFFINSLYSFILCLFCKMP